MRLDYTSRIAAFRRAMTTASIDLAAIGPSSHMDWLIGFHPHSDERLCLLLIGPATETLVLGALNADGTRTRTDVAFHVWEDDIGPTKTLVEAISFVGSANAKQIVLDETMRADFALLVIDALPSARTSLVNEALGFLRMRKDSAERLLLKANATIADRAMSTAYAAICPGMSEKGLASVIQAQLAKDGASLEFCIVASGANGAIPYHETGTRQFKEGDAVLIDFGGRYQGFLSDISRMAVVGYPPQAYDRIHCLVESAVKAGLQAARPGVFARDVDAAVRGVIAEAGYGEFFTHRTGHGLGIDLHEPPYITGTSDTLLQEGMVFSIEPGVYLPGRFGVRLEEIVILHADGAEVLSALPRRVHVSSHPIIRNQG
ncbi:M24 family metallopeptidase [Mesorhizobium sp. RIZ17]|uniref:M24 family metallopeptidase n=1 Tax=Mesorhizobium sp. RIZ17 TaxID=3132743 RepID=UPI003DA95805